MNTQAAAFGRIHAGCESRPFVANLATEIDMLHGVPLTINHGGDRGNAWVCSPLTTYSDYAREECRRYLHPTLAMPVAAMCRACGYLMRRARIDRAVTVNNWLLSTNLYPPLQKAQAEQLVDTVLQRWPDHAIWFRSLNGAQNADWLAFLRERGFALIPSRQVYFFNAGFAGDKRSADLKRDMKLLQTTPLRRVAPGDFTEADCPRIAALYAHLYLDKYSTLNPQYTPAFFSSWMQGGLVQFHGFRDAEGVLQGVVGLFRQNGTITAPVVGYNTALPVKLGLYRLLMACVLEQATLAHSAVNLSAGAAHFKRLRGGRPLIEYSAVLVRHLPLRRRALIAVLRALTTWIGVPLMRKFKL